MPPTLPLGGVPRVGIVMARLIVSGADHGIRPFIVPLNDGKQMCKNIVARCELYHCPLRRFAISRRLIESIQRDPHPLRC